MCNDELNRKKEERLFKVQVGYQEKILHGGDVQALEQPPQGSGHSTELARVEEASDFWVALCVVRHWT